MKKYILHINNNYSLEILRPIQVEIIARGGECIWYVGGANVNLKNFVSNESYTLDPSVISSYDACAVFTPGNVVPDFLVGLKVQVFHGLEWKKKGHFKIRDFFDLYCTQGPITTKKFNELASKHKNFLVCETGWSKLDPLFSIPPFCVPKNKKVVLYAPTFSENLSSAEILFDEISRLVRDKDWYWIVKFHPLMKKEWVDMYSFIKADNFQVIHSHSILSLLQAADVMLSDTSSVIGEFLLLDKPVVTLNNSAPGIELININQTFELEAALEQGLRRESVLIENIQKANEQLHPYTDGRSSARILDAVDYILTANVKPAKKRPLNFFRNFKIRKRLAYWKF